jgi:transposase-like protein
METMFDSVNIANIPEGSAWVAGYVNGTWPTYDELVKKFPHARHVSITVNKNERADVLDVEEGDASTDDAVTWVRAMREQGRTPIVYTSAARVSPMLDYFRSQNEPEPLLWVADWTNEPHLYPGSVATQWANGTEQYPGLARNCDTSLVSPNWPAEKKESIVKTIGGYLDIAPFALEKASIATPTTKKEVKTMNINTNQLGSWFRQLIAYAGIATQLANEGHLPTSVRTAIVAVSGVLLSVEHYAAKK